MDLLSPLDRCVPSPSWLTFPGSTYRHLTHWLPEFFIFLTVRVSSPECELYRRRDVALLSLLCLQHLKLYSIHSCVGFPRWLSGNESACQCMRCRRPRLDPWVRKISWGRKWQLPPVFLPGESYGYRSLVGYSSRRCKRVGHD